MFYVSEHIIKIVGSLGNWLIVEKLCEWTLVWNTLMTGVLRKEGEVKLGRVGAD